MTWTAYLAVTETAQRATTTTVLAKIALSTWAAARNRLSRRERNTATSSSPRSHKKPLPRPSPFTTRAHSRVWVPAAPIRGPGRSFPHAGHRRYCLAGTADLDYSVRYDKIVANVIIGIPTAPRADNPAGCTTGLAGGAAGGAACGVSSGGQSWGGSWPRPSTPLRYAASRQAAACRYASSAPKRLR